MALLRILSTHTKAVSLLLLLAIPQKDLQAHYVSRGVGSAIQVSIQDAKIRLTFDLGFGSVWALGEMRDMDTNGDRFVSESEADAYREKTWKETIYPHLLVTLNGMPLPLQLISSTSEGLVGELTSIPFDVYYELEAEIPYAGPEEMRKNVRLQIENRVLERDSTSPPLFLIPFTPPGNNLTFVILEPPPLLDLQGYVVHGRKLILKFDLSGGNSLEGDAKLLPPEGRTGAKRPGISRDLEGKHTAESKGERFLEEAIRSRDLGFWTACLFFVLSFAYGAGHALAPGHGKTLVAAYLVGTRGRIRDAAFLGAVVTFTHTFSVFLVGLLIHFTIQATGSSVKEQTLRNWYIVGYSLLGGAMLLLIGLVLFFQRWRWAGHPDRMREAAHHHHHGHQHDNDDKPASPNPQACPGSSHRAAPSLWEMFSLGVAGGIVPCPAGLTVIALGLYYPERFLLALFLVVVFSIGLGSVLIGLGILLVTGRSFLLEGSETREKFFSYLPALSALFIASLGVFFLVGIFQSHRPEIADMLDALSSWIRGR